MKLTNTQNMKASKSGMTLLELTVVILVLLSLISILFIGARAWKKGSDRAASILQIRNVQQAVRSYGNMYGKQIDVADEVTLDDIFGDGKFMKNNPTASTHPAGTDYKFQILAPTKIPAVGTLYMDTISNGTGGTDFADMNPSSHADW